MHEVLTRFIPEMIGRIDGPMKFRLLLQPCVALLFAVRDGRKDVRAGRPPYNWAVLSDPGQRQMLLQEGWKSIAKLFAVALILDLVYQYVEIKGFRPMQSLATACLLAIIPYMLMRSAVNRLSPRQGRTE